mmetsp:Transcript_265/g.524  ORF Transcript_265/g.524 Transcript_265/m.524 type:complete len:120 (-) Transcript_265:32-391(-)
MGLVYDFALVVLGDLNLLWNREEGEDGIDGDDDVDEEFETAEDDTLPLDSATSAAATASLGMSDNNYNDHQNEWNDIFHSFSLASTFPQRTFDNDLGSTLEECGLSHGAIMLMVVVESD